MNDGGAGSPYRMSISLNILNHLGIGLYSNMPAVLSEVVANAWDADAHSVTININRNARRIEIIDDGKGMTRADINAKYLTVGYSKRESEPALTELKRRPMGRKGIGKLSVFSIANAVEVHSSRDGEASGFLMTVEDIERQIKAEGGEGTYYPEPVKADPPEKGTRIILSQVKKELGATSANLRRRIARRFSIIGAQHQFEVVIDGEPVTAADRDFYHNLEFVWYFGSESLGIVKRCTACSKSEELPNEVDRQLGYLVEGWIGTVDERRSLSDQDNTIVVLANGKLVHEDLLKDLREGGIYSKYIIGEITADFMDLDDAEDIITSGRQSLKEDDPRYLALRAFIDSSLNRIESQWTRFRTDTGAQRALENPVVKEWFESLEGDNKEYAKKLFGKIESFKIMDPAARSELYKASMLGFHTLALRQSLSVLDKIESEEQLLLFGQLFQSVDQLEAAHYYQVAKSRLDVIRQFVDIVPEAKERVLQRHIFDHLWLLHPSWERASTNERIEQSVMKEFGRIDARLSTEERAARIDIRYRTAAGKHIIIELKKYDRDVSIEELTAQVRKYRDALVKCLKDQYPDEPRAVETICILGKAPTPRDHEEDNRKSLDIYNARFITYDALIQDALRSYEEYLEREKRVSDLINLIERMEEGSLERVVGVAKAKSTPARA